MHRNGISRVSTCAAVLAAAAFLLPSPSAGLTLASLITKPTFENAGIRVAYTGDADANGTISVEYRAKGSSNWQPGHPMVRIKGNRFATSLFKLSEGTTYEVRLSPQDAEGVAVSFAQPFEITTRSSIVPSNGNNLYVDAAAAASGSGTQAAPFTTIQEAAAAAQPGDVVHIRPGTYREQVQPGKSGVDNAWIRYTGEGAGVILDGSEIIPTASGWTSEGSGVYSRAYSRTPAFGTLDDIRLFAQANIDSLRLNGAGVSGGFCVANGRLYVKAPDGGSLAGRTVRMSANDYGFFLDGLHHIIIENLNIGYYNTADVRLRNAHHNTISRCRIYQSRDMVSIDHLGATDNLVQYCNLWGTGVPGWPWVTCHHDHDCSSNAIKIEVAGEGNVARYDTCRGVFNGIYLGDWDLNYPEAYALENDIYGNVLENIVDDGLEPECQGINLRMYGNHFHNVYSPISLAPIETGPAWIMFNVIENSWINSPGYQYWEGGPGWIKISTTPSGAIAMGALRIYHNTARVNKPNEDGWGSCGSGNTHIKNNIVMCTQYVFDDVESVPFPPGNEWDYNNFYTTDPTRYVKFENVRLTIPEFQAKGYQVHGISAPPRFIDTASGDFHLRSDDPGINKGVYLPGINDGYAGSAPDMGAYEYQPVTSAQSFLPPAAQRANTDLMCKVNGAKRFITVPVPGPGLYKLSGYDLSGHRLWERMFRTDSYAAHMKNPDRSQSVVLVKIAEIKRPRT
jgi:hypothetical protein